MKRETVLVIFGEELPHGWSQSRNPYSIVVASEKLQQFVEVAGLTFVSIESFIKAESIYEASALFEELSQLKLADGSRITKSSLYEGYELWWIHCDSLFTYFCLPYTKYERLLEYLKDFQSVHMYRPPYGGLFTCYLQAHETEMIVVRELGLKSSFFLPLGVFLQILLTLVSLPILATRRRRTMVYTGDKFEKDKDYDFRMRFIYEELRQRGVPFIEFIRGLESWKTVLQHAFTRGRPVVYSEAVIFVGRFVSFLSGGHRRAKREFAIDAHISEGSTEVRFRLSVATWYLPSFYDDIWAIRIMKWILRIIGVRAAMIAAANERNWSTVLGCKLNAIPTIGIMHATASRHYNMYDFLPGFDGTRMLSVDTYGLWSEWWKEYYIKNSRAYKPGQLFVSGPMRPLSRTDVPVTASKGSPLKVLFISEQLGVPEEVLPYLSVLLDAKDLFVYLKFRPYRDGLEEWLKEHQPEVLKRIGKMNIMRGDMNEAVVACDVAVGSHSTAVLEALLQLKPFVFFDTRKWGDYYRLKTYDEKHSFFAENPEELVQKIKDSRSVTNETLVELRERYFGDPHRNGSKWVVDQLEVALSKGCATR